MLPAPTCTPRGSSLSTLHPIQLHESRQTPGPAGAPGLGGAMAPRGRYGPIAPGPGAKASSRRLALRSESSSALRSRRWVRRQPGLPRPIPPLPAPRPSRLSAPPPSSLVRACGGHSPKEGGAFSPTQSPAPGGEGAPQRSSLQSALPSSSAHRHEGVKRLIRSRRHPTGWCCVSQSVPPGGGGTGAGGS